MLRKKWQFGQIAMLNTVPILILVRYPLGRHEGLGVASTKRLRARRTCGYFTAYIYSSGTRTRYICEDVTITRRGRQKSGGWVTLQVDELCYLGEYGNRGGTESPVPRDRRSSNLRAQLSALASSFSHRRCRTHAGATTPDSLRVVLSRANTRVGGAMNSSKVRQTSKLPLLASIERLSSTTWYTACNGSNAGQNTPGYICYGCTHRFHR